MSNTKYINSEKNRKHERMSWKPNIGKWKSPEHAKVIDEFMNNEKAVSLLKKLGYKA